MKYKIAIKTIDFVEIEANSEDQAINLVKDSLVKTKQIKACDPIEFEIVTEQTLNV